MNNNVRLSKRWIRIAVAALMCLFILVNVFWLYYRFALYGPFINITKDARFPGEQVSQKDKVTYSIADLHYLDFRGNLAISTDKGEDLIVWLHVIMPDEYGFTSIDNSGNVYQLMIDERGNLLKESQYPTEIISYFEENKTELSSLMNAYALWKEAAKEKNTLYFDSPTRI